MLKKLETTYVSLHIIGMVTMLLDHLWATILPQFEIFTCIGRITFPIFAFLLVEGYSHTSDVKKYCLRLLIFALISEVPFDLVYASTPYYPYHQNVMWTMLLGVLMFKTLDSLPKGKTINLITSFLVIIGFFLLAAILMVDVYGTGLLTMAIFYKFKDRKPLDLVLTTLLIYYINTEILGGYYYDVNILGMHFEIVQQSLATLALIPIFLYKGKKGNSPKWFKYFNYAFYPAHLLILYLIYIIVW